MVSSAENPTIADLPAELKVQLWKRVERRLRQGQVLITNDQFFRVMALEFSRLVKIEPDRGAKLAILRMIMAVNEERPETYLTLGIKNAVTAYFKEAEERMAGQEGAVDEARQMIKQMISEGRTAFFLESLGVSVTDAALNPAINAAILRVVDGKKLKAAPKRKPRQRQRRAASSMVAVHTSATEPGEEEPTEKPEVAELPDEKEQSERIGEERERAETTVSEEIERAPRNLDAYRDQDYLSEEEVTDLRTLYGIDQRLKDGEIDEEEANRLRAEIDETVREKLQQRLREAVDHTVHYVNSFEALKRFSEERDAALKFIIKFKARVSSVDEDVDLGVVTRTLEEDDELVDNLGTIMERKDHESRMIAAGMPPYRHIYSNEKLATFTVEEKFVDDLRSMTREEVSDRLNSEDAGERVRAAADLKCVVALIDLLMQGTPFHREVRRLRIIVRMKKIYSGSVDERDGRNKVQQFLRRRLQNLYPNLSKEEKAALEAAGTAICEGREKAADESEEKGKRVYRA